MAERRDKAYYEQEHNVFRELYGDMLAKVTELYEEAEKIAERCRGDRAYYGDEEKPTPLAFLSNDLADHFYSIKWHIEKAIETEDEHNSDWGWDTPYADEWGNPIYED